MTEIIFALFRQRRKRPPMDAVTADRLALMHWRVQRLGDRVRDLNQWRDGYRLRTGRAA